MCIYIKYGACYNLYTSCKIRIRRFYKFMKHYYQTPQIDFALLDEEDIITQSAGAESDPFNNGYEPWLSA